MLVFILGLVTAANAFFTHRIYRKCGARFDLTYIDPLTYLFFLQMIMASLGSYLIGASLFDNDWINYLEVENPIRLIGWLAVQYGFIGCAIGLYFGLKLLNPCYSSTTFLNNLVKKNIPKKHHLLISVFLLSLCAFSGLYVFQTLGTIPLLSVISSSGHEIAKLRSATKLSFSGITFVRDYGFVAVAQVVSYYLFSLKLKYGKSLIYRLLFWVSLSVSILALTLNLEKGPIVIFFFSLLVIRFFHGRKSSIVGQGFTLFLILGLLFAVYLAVLGTDRTFAFYFQEILGRIVIAQVAGVFMTLSIFPVEYEFILFSGIGVLSDIVGFEQSLGSPRIVMQHFRPAEVEMGLLGYKSSYFMAEAYGNFGYVGLLLSPFMVGIVTALYFSLFIRFQNGHLAIAGITYLTFNLPFTSNFVPFYYNPGLWILLVILTFAGNLRTKKYRNFKTRLSDECKS